MTIPTNRMSYADVYEKFDEAKEDPKVGEAFAMGFRAADTGATAADNPFDDGSPAGKKWLAANQKKKNKARDAWRKKKRREAKRALRRSNDGAMPRAVNNQEI